MFSQKLDYGLINNSWNGSLDLLIKSIENEDSVLCWYSETDGCHAQCRPSWTWYTDIIRNHPSYVFYIWNSMFCHHFSLHKTWFCYETYVCEMVDPNKCHSKSICIISGEILTICKHYHCTSILYIAETKILSFWQNIHCLYWNLSKWQVLMQLLTKIFIECVCGFIVLCFVVVMLSVLSGFLW